MPDSSFRPDPVAAQYARGGSSVVVARGELDVDTVPLLARALERAAAAAPVVVLDVGGVTFADSTTLNLLLRTHRATTLRIAAPQTQLLHLLEVTGADHVLRLYPSTDDACAAAAS
ncbi:STAS domain-containing protein [Streptomyces sp. NPDC055808]